jgi:hypothetical protein
MLGNSRVAAQLAASQEGLSCMKLVRSTIIAFFLFSPTFLNVHLLSLLVVYLFPAPFSFSYFPLYLFFH